MIYGAELDVSSLNHGYDRAIVINSSPSILPLRHSAYKYSGNNPPAPGGGSKVLAFLFHTSFVSGTVIFRHGVTFAICAGSPERRRPDSHGFHPKTNSIPSIIHSNYGNQPSRPLAVEGSLPSDDGEMSNIDDEIDLPSVEEILARAKGRQPHASLPKYVIDLTSESDNDDTAISLRRKHVRSSLP
jgi:hypothetical protein